jgi:hypothetical protein
LRATRRGDDQRHSTTRFHYPYFRTGFWVRGRSREFARISSRTLGRYVVVINPLAPPRCRSNEFQRISVTPQTTPEEPRQWNGPLGAPKRRPDPPQPAPHPRPQLMCGGNHGTGTHWCLSGGALRCCGGAPTPGALNRVQTSRAIPKAPRSTRQKAQRYWLPGALTPVLPSYEK